MEVTIKNLNKDIHNMLEALKSFFITYWAILLIGFVFSLTRIRYLTYPLGLFHRQVVKEGFRSYEAITTGGRIYFHIYLEQPLYVFLLEIGYNLFDKSPDNLVLWGRIIGFIFSALSLILIYKISEMTFGDVAAKFAAFLYSISPYIITMGIAIQRETLMWLFGLCAILYLLKYLETKEKKFIVLNITFSILSIMTKFTGVYILFVSLVSLILFYSNSENKKNSSLKKRILLLLLFFISMILIAFSFALSNLEKSPQSPLRHSIVFQPEALLDTEFWSNMIIYALLHIPSTTVLLGIIGLILVLSSDKKENYVLLIWTLFAGMEIIFYGYGAIIHEYYILYLLHPLVILAGNTLLLIYKINFKQAANNRYLPNDVINPLLILFLFLSSGFIPLFNFTEEMKMIKANEPLYHDIRSIGLFLKDSNISGREIVIIYSKENYEWWKFSLTLTRTYIAKPGIDEYQTSDISETVRWGRYKAIIGWSDDLDQARKDLPLHFDNHTIYPQKIPFRAKIDLPPVEMWFNSY